MNSTERYCPTCGANNTSNDEHCFACGALLDNSLISEDETNAAHILKQRYRLLNQVGSGGFSAVYKAEDLKTKKLVAVKAVSLRGLSPQEKIEATDAYNREVGLLGTLQQRNLPHIYDQFTEPECWYLIMDFIEGITLEKRLEQIDHEQLSLDMALDIGLILCDVLEYLHHQSPPIIFRDLKPGNIMLTLDGHLYLIDFGIARRFKPGQAKDTIPFGSPGYAAPEQYGKAQTTPQADIYSLGAILHQLLSGNDPSLSPFAFAPLTQDHLPALGQLNALIQQMVQLDVKDRPENIKVVKQTLLQIASNKEIFHIYGGTNGQVGASTGFYRPRYTTTQTTGGQSPFSQQAQGQVMAQTFALPTPPPAQMFTYAPVPNYLATLSLMCSLIGIFLPPFFCFATQSTILAIRSANETPIPVLFFFVLLLFLPSILGIILGHIAKRRANIVPGMQSSTDVAVTGITIGYIFGIIYLIFTICIFTSVMR